MTSNPTDPHGDQVAAAGDRYRPGYELVAEQ
ncbi:MAG: hypothetical protein QOK08_1232, partial [Actinomycetota bacterium]|nr:hypothetical protein [Actinomycetota bacterium]